MIESLLAVLAGCMAGVFTGMAPGIHVNTVSALLLVFAASGDINVVLAIVSMSVVQTFVDFVPSIALGAPDSESFLSVLPGHRFLLKGEGNYAIKLTIIGGLFGGIISVLLLPVFSLFIIRFVALLYAVIPALIISVLCLMVLDESPGEMRKWALVVIALSALLGLVVLRGNAGSGTALFPLVTGFFGVPTLLYSLKERMRIARQEITDNSYRPGLILSGSLMSSIAGAVVSLFPSIGPNQAAFLLRKISGRISPRKYLVILGGINTSNMIFSFFVLYLMGKTRTGSAAAIKQLVGLGFNDMLLIVAAVLIALGFGAVVTELAGKFLLAKMGRINYRALNIAVLALLVLLVLALNGLSGLLIFAAATSVGMVAIASHVKRTNCMAFLMLPTLVFYLGI